MRNAVLAGLALAAGYYVLGEVFSSEATPQSVPTDVATSTTPGMGGSEGGGGGSLPSAVGGGRIKKRDNAKVPVPAGWGRFSWNVPATMVKDETVMAHAFIDPLMAPSRPRATGEASVKTSQTMKVTLRSVPKDAIVFAPIGDEEQVLEDGSAEWSWTATPMVPGRATVVIEASRYLKTGDFGVKPKTAVSDHREVNVDVRPGPKSKLGQPIVDAIRKEVPSAIGKWVGVAVAGALGALGPGLLALWKKASKKKAPKPPKDDGIV